jgi:alpha-L-fucosidase
MAVAPAAEPTGQGNTMPGVDGFDALYGKKQSKEEFLHYKWIPNAAPNPHPDAQWFHSAALGLFQHWGIVSGSSRGEAWDVRMRLEKNGKPLSEEERMQFAISPQKMFDRAKLFKPDRYDPDRWMRAASAAGFRYAVLTTRHHDAYFLGDSRFGDWHAGHYVGRDLIAPWVQACRDHGLKVGFYFSGPDWYHGREYQNYTFPEEKKPPYYNWKHEKVDSLPAMPDTLKSQVRTIAHGQVRELLTGYGKVDLFWPDGGAAGFSIEESRRLQPGIIWGRGYEYATPEGWGMMKMEFIKEANRRGYPWEFNTIGHGGSWHWSERAEEKGISAAQLVSTLAQVRARGGNLPLNIAPRPDGEMPHWFYPMCEKVAAWMKTGAEAIYNVSVKGPFPCPDQCKQPITVGAKAWYLFASADPKKVTEPCVIQDVARPAAVTLLRSGAALPFEYAAGQLTVRITPEQRTDMPEVIKILWP